MLTTESLLWMSDPVRKSKSTAPSDSFRLFMLNYCL